MAKLNHKKLYKYIEDIIEERFINVLNDLEVENDTRNIIIETNRKISQTVSSTRKQQTNISGYNLFAREMFPIVRQENEDTTTKDILRIIANLWKESHQDIKNEYNQRAKNIKPLTKEQKQDRQKIQKSKPKNNVKIPSIKQNIKKDIENGNISDTSSSSKTSIRSIKRNNK